MVVRAGGLWAWGRGPRGCDFSRPIGGAASGSPRSFRRQADPLPAGRQRVRSLQRRAVGYVQWRDSRQEARQSGDGLPLSFAGLLSSEV